MKKIKNQRGLTLVEMLVTLVIAAIMMLSIGVLSGMSNRSYARQREEAAVYTDVSYGFKLLQNRVHEGGSLQVLSQSGQWQGNRLMISSHQVFGIYQASGSTTKEFVYLPDSTNENNREIILSVPAPGSLNVNVSVTGGAVNLQVYGTKGKTPFDFSTVVVRRS
jgi:prepilin-type N-terminal cleavage/methylation domain-containing protein